MSDIVFGTDGWRGLIARDFTFDNVRLVTQAIATYIKGAYPSDRPVLIGYDTRFLADEFAREAAWVLEANGLLVEMSIQDVPTPVIAYAARELKSAGALMFTASHNPPMYCGIKYIPDYAGPATPDITNQIVANVKELQGQRKPIALTQGAIPTFDPKPAYVSYVKTLLSTEVLADFDQAIAYDALYGTGRKYVSTILSQISGCQVHAIHENRDVLFGGGMPEPNPHYLGPLVDLIAREKCALGLSNDGDADRFGIVGEDGLYYTPNQVIALLARHLIKNKGKRGAIVRTVATTHQLDRLAAHYGVDLVETPVGFKYVGEMMRQRPVVIGGEESGGLSVIDHIPEKDGILADLLVVEMLAYERKPLSQIWRDLVAEVGFEPANLRLDLHLTEERKQAVMTFFQGKTPTRIGDRTVTDVRRIDGVKCLLDDGSWCLVRPSGTEPLVRVYLEAGDRDRLATLKQTVEALIQGITE